MSKNSPPDLTARRDACSGCSACAAICPQGAIAMEPDEEGFLCPVIDAEKCVRCGLCQKVCAFKAYQTKRAECTEHTECAEGSSELKKFPQAFAVKHANAHIRENSQSGGLFTLISDAVLARGGVIYGAGFRDDLSVCHKRAATKDERDALRGSKYVQSDMGDAFRSVREDLKQGREVLFTGTPCQCAGLRRFLELLRTDMSRLCLLDLICHGTPTPRLWKEYLNWQEARNGQKIVQASFRDKRRFGWRSHVETLTFADGTVISDKLYTTIFYRHLALRPSCHACPYAMPHRCSDISMGDFWGLEKVLPGFADNLGVSLALVHSEKGSKLFDEARPRMDVISCSVQDCLQPQLRHPAAPSPRRKAFWRFFHRNPSVVFALTDDKLILSHQLEFPLRLRRILRGRLHRAIK